MMNSRGFTLIESLISILLLSICLAGGIKLYFYADQLSALSIHKRVANEMINSRIEDLRNSSYNSITTTGTAVSITTINVGGLSANEFVTVRLVDQTGQPITPYAFKEVTVRVNWSESEDPNLNQRDYEVVTYIAP